MEKGLRSGPRGEIDEFVLRMNRAAEGSSPAARIFWNAITGTTFEDAEDPGRRRTAATDYFRRRGRRVTRRRFGRSGGPQGAPRADKHSSAIILPLRRSAGRGLRRPGARDDFARWHMPGRAAARAPRHPDAGMSRADDCHPGGHKGRPDEDASAISFRMSGRGSSPPVPLSPVIPRSAAENASVSSR